MANQSEKRRLEANRGRLQLMFRCIVGANVWHLLLRFWLRKSSLFWFNYVTFIASNTVHFVAYSILKGAAQPRYGPSGDLISGGADLKMRGFVEYVTDAIILTIILQILGGLSDWAWLLILIAPTYAGYVAWTYYQQFSTAQKQNWQGLGLRESQEKINRRREQRRRR